MILSKFQYNKYITNEEKLGLNVNDRVLPDSLLEQHDCLDKDLDSFKMTMIQWAQLHVQSLCSDIEALTN